MKTYLVGGAVRDRLLGREVSDRDYVVVGSTPEEMLSLGYKQVGADFPVFLHPVTGEEYALARTERKSGVGYHGFTVTADPTVTLEADLARRDLTINSMAMDLETGKIADPYGGLADLAQGVLRHTSLAFADDPLRVLRLARFAARFTTFKVADETLELCERMVKNGELAHLTQERVWLEVQKAIPADGLGFTRFYEVLSGLYAFDFVPALKPLSNVPSSALANVLFETCWMQTEVRLAVVIGSLMHFGRHSLTSEEARGLPAGALRVKELLALDWHDMEPERVYGRLLCSGALRGGWDFVRSALATVEQSVCTLHYLALTAALQVKASAYPELRGKELGDALKRGKIDAIRHALT